VGTAATRRFGEEKTFLPMPGYKPPDTLAHSLVTTLITISRLFNNIYKFKKFIITKCTFWGSCLYCGRVGVANSSQKLRNHNE
jgi:hypothetical protein